MDGVTGKPPPCQTCFFYIVEEVLLFFIKIGQKHLPSTLHMSSQNFQLFDGLQHLTALNCL